MDRSTNSTAGPAQATVTVLGLGNILMGDEGAGVRALDALRERYEFPESVRFLDGGTLGLDLIFYLEDTEKLLVIDAIDSGAPPGTIKILEGPEIPSVLAGKFSVHQIGLQDLFFALDIMEKRPSHACLVGVVPKVVDLGLELSPEVKKALPGVSDAVVGRLGGWGISVKEKAGFNSSGKRASGKRAASGRRTSWENKRG